MKTLRMITAAVGMLSTGALFASDPAPRTVVTFDHPENFTDVKDSSIPTDRGRDAILDTLREYVVERTARLVPDGDRLAMTFTDIDLAGDFEPWRGAQWGNVRIVKSTYPPAFKFTYAVTNPEGRVVAQGAEDIRDMTFQTRLTMDPSDPLRYEKQLLDDWAQSSLRGLKRD